jgi:hypothetical protein
MEESIHQFDGNLLAFWRPRKRTYYFLSWKPDANRWEHYDEEHTPFTLHKTTLHERGSVTIRIKSAGPRHYQTRIHCDGTFLLNGPLVIPIAKSMFPAQGARIKREYTAEDIYATTIPYQRPQHLWTLTPPAPAAAPKPKAKPKPIPRRIAWLIAEDACKNKEACPISMEDISPITASVTSCFHVFDTPSLNIWLQEKNTCPSCREPCAAQTAFENEAATEAAPLPQPHPEPVHAEP